MEKHVYTVNSIRPSGLNQRQSKAFLTEVESDHDVIYFSHVHWLSRVATPARFWSLAEEIRTFMTNEGKEVSFMDDDEWSNDLASPSILQT